MFVGGRRLRLVHGVLGLALGASIVGCSGSSDSPTTLLPISTPPSTTPSTQPPTDPKAAAVAVVREYFRLLNELPNTMDSKGIAQLMTPSCSCQEQVQAIRHANSQGEHYVDHWRHLSLTPATNGNASVDVLARYDASAGGLVDAHGKRVTYAAPKKGVQRLFRVVMHAGTWKIDEIQAA